MPGPPCLVFYISGHGLGHEFLRHVERTRVLVHLVEPFPPDGADPLENYRTIRRELELHSPALAMKAELVAVLGDQPFQRHARDLMAEPAEAGPTLARSREAHDTDGQRCRDDGEDAPN